MKTISTLNWAFAAVFSALALTACNDDYLEVPGAANNDSKGFHTVRFEAAMQQQGAQDVARVAKPRTIIESTVDGYATKWAIGDIIDVFEVAYGVPVAATGAEGEAEASSTEDKSQKYASKALAAEDIDGSGKAVFSVDLANDNAGGTKYEYYAVYPHTSCAEGWEYESLINIGSAWTSEIDDAYQWWKEQWGYNGPYVEPHPTLMVELPCLQSPTADSFDPKADLMVSKTDAGHALVDGGRASTTSAPVGVPVSESIPSRKFPSSIGETETEVDCETGIKVMAKNLYRSFDSTLGYALLPEVNTDWVIYSTTTPFKELAKYELYVSYTNVKAVTEAMQFYVTNTPGSLEGAVLVQPTSIETWDDMYKVIYDLPGGYTHFYIKGHHKNASTVAHGEVETYPFYICQYQYLYGYK